MQKLPETSSLELEFEAHLGVSRAQLAKLAAVVFRRFGMSAHAERCADAVQEWVLLALQAKGGPQNRPAAYRIMLRACATQALRGKRRMATLDERMTRSLPDRSRVDPGEFGAVQASIEQLDETAQKLIRARYYDGLSYVQITAATGVGLSTVRATLRKAERALADGLRSALSVRNHVSTSPPRAVRG